MDTPLYDYPHVSDRSGPLRSILTRKDPGPSVQRGPVGLSSKVNITLGTIQSLFFLEYRVDQDREVTCPSPLL